MSHRNSQVSVPLALSSLGCGFLWNNPSIGEQYLYGEDILVAPVLKANDESQKVYLPEGGWVEYEINI